MNDYIQLWYDEYETEARTLMHDIWEHPEFAMENLPLRASGTIYEKNKGLKRGKFNARRA